jgi:predicted secreted protein
MYSERSTITTGTEHGAAIADFSVSASRTVTPDTLTASLAYVVTGNSLAAVQQQLNAAMKGFVATAKAGAGYKVSTGRYHAGEAYGRNGQKSGQFQAQQTLTLTGTDTQNILDMVAKLQQAGLQVQGLYYSMSAAQAGSLNNELLAEAVAKANTTAQALSNAVGALGFELVQISPTLPGDGASNGGMRAMAASVESAGAAFDAPTAEAAEATITLTLGVVYRLLTGTVHAFEAPGA